MEAPSPLSSFDTPLALADASGRLVDLSAGFAAWFPGAAPGADLGALLPPDSLGACDERLVERDVVTLRSGKTPVELRIRRRGDLWSVEGRALEGERRRDDLLAFYADVARRSNRALAAQRDAAQELLDALGRPVFAVGADGRPTGFATPECEALFGDEPHAVDVPAFLARDLPEGDAETLGCAYRAAFGEGLPVFEALREVLPEHVRPARGAADELLVLASHPVLDDAGALVRIVHEARRTSAAEAAGAALARIEAKLDALSRDREGLLHAAGF